MRFFDANLKRTFATSPSSTTHIPFRATPEMYLILTYRTTSRKRHFLLKYKSLLLEEWSSEVKVDVGIFQVIVLVLGFLDRSGLFFFLGRGVLPLVRLRVCKVCRKHPRPTWLGNGPSEEGLAVHTTGLWPCSRIKTQQCAEQGLCIWGEPLVRILVALFSSRTFSNCLGKT